MPHVLPGPDGIAVAHVQWPKAWRIIASRSPQSTYPVSPDPAVWEAVNGLEQATNPRIRDRFGEIGLVPSNRCVSDPNVSRVMVAFSHLNQGSRGNPCKFVATRSTLPGAAGSS